MEIKIDKKFFISIGIVLFLCIASFLAGRYIRFKRVDGVHRELESGIILQGESADRLLDELGITRPAGQSAVDTGYAVLKGVKQLSRSSESARSCINEIQREVRSFEQYNNSSQESISGALDTVEYILQLSIEQARALESITDSLQQYDNNTKEND